MSDWPMRRTAQVAKPLGFALAKRISGFHLGNHRIGGPLDLGRRREIVLKVPIDEASVPLSARGDFCDPVGLGEELRHFKQFSYRSGP